ncbi:MAG: hypothetical protein WBD28_08725, partial [Candidatus Zixiibacteriota bacterium]
EIGREIIVPLLERMGCRDVKFCGGPREKGADIRYSFSSIPDQVKKFTGIQIKKGNIDAKSKNEANITELVTQARKALVIPYFDPLTQKEYTLSRYIICGFGEITSEAQEYIKQRLKEDKFEKDIDFWPGMIIAQYIHDYYLENFTKYFNIQAEELEETYEASIKLLFKDLYSRMPQEEEIIDIWNFARKRGLKPKQIKGILTDTDLQQKLNVIYKELLKREVDPVGQVAWGYLYRLNPNEERLMLIRERIMQSHEFIMKLPKIKFSFNDQPMIQASFDRLFQSVNGWITYHGTDCKGQLNIIHDEEVKASVAEIIPYENGKYFRIQYPMSVTAHQRKKVRLNFKTKHHFEFFVFSLAKDGKNYFVRYTPTKSGQSKSQYGGIQYALHYIGKNFLDNKWYNIDIDVGEDLKSVFNVDLSHILYFCFSVTGPFKVGYIELF